MRPRSANLQVNRCMRMARLAYILSALRQTGATTAFFDRLKASQRAMHFTHPSYLGTGNNESPIWSKVRQSKKGYTDWKRFFESQGGRPTAVENGGRYLVGCFPDGLAMVVFDSQTDGQPPVSGDDGCR